MTVVDRLVRWVNRANARLLRLLPPDDEVFINERQHPAVLIAKAIRTGSGVGMLISRPTLGLMLLFGGAVLAEALRSFPGLRRRTVLGLTVALTFVLFVLAHGSPALRACAGAALVGWLVVDVLTWFFDRLIVTNRRLYRLHGLVTKHLPSVALQSITVVDVELGPAARWFGTLNFDTPAQRDSPLHRFTYVPDAGAVHVRILDLRAAASARNPPPG